MPRADGVGAVVIWEAAMLVTIVVLLAISTAALLSIASSLSRKS